MTTKRLTPARFKALHELAMKPRPASLYDKRTVRALMDAGLIEWCETTATAHIYRVTSAAWPVLRDHVDFLEKREAKGAVYRSDFEMDVQTNPETYRDALEWAERASRPETPADRVAKASVHANQNDAAPFGSATFAEAVIRSALDVVQAAEDEAAPAPLPKRPAGGSAIADAVARYRTPLVKADRRQLKWTREVSIGNGRTFTLTANVRLVPFAEDGSGGPFTVYYSRPGSFDWMTYSSAERAHAAFDRFAEKYDADPRWTRSK